MKSFFKRSAISLVVLGMVGSVYAAKPAHHHNTNTSWSPQFTGVFLGVEGLDLRAMNGDLDYVLINPTLTGTSFGSRAVSTSYDWDWRVYGGIRFTDNDDITLSWMQMRNSDHSSINASSVGGVISSFNPVWLNNLPALTAWNNVNGHTTFDLDDAYAVWGHTVNFENPWSVRFAAGVEYAKIDSDLRVLSTPSSNLGNFGTVGFQSNSHTKGFGPRLEFDMDYKLPYGFGLFGKANAALLISKRNVSLNPTIASVTGTINTVDNTTLNFYYTDFATRHVVVPKFGARLGASYAYTWGQGGAEGACRTTTLMIDAGWQAESYIHAVERPASSFITSTATSITQTVGSLGTKTSNFGDQGFFVGIQLGTDWM